MNYISKIIALLAFFVGMFLGCLFTNAMIQQDIEDGIMEALLGDKVYKVIPMVIEYKEAVE
jgi:hypothetical protein